AARIRLIDVALLVSSRRRHTRSKRDWSSDVCSSDLGSMQFSNYVEAFQVAPFGRYLLNSVFVTLLSTIGEVLTAILAAFAFARLNFYGKDILFALLLATMMVPGELLIIPNFVTLANLDWINTYMALIVPWL